MQRGERIGFKVRLELSDLLPREARDGQQFFRVGLSQKAADVVRMLMGDDYQRGAGQRAAHP